MYIVVPEPIPMVAFNGEKFRETIQEDGKPVERDMKPMTIHEYLFRYVFNQVSNPARDGNGNIIAGTGTPKMGLGYAGNKRCAKLDRAFKNKKPGDVVEVDDETYHVVKKIIEETPWGATTLGAMFEPIEDAWMNAKMEKPVVNPVETPVVASA